MSNRQGVWSLVAQYQAIADQDWTMAPGAPTGVSATAGSTEATVTFTAPTFAGIPGTITGFKVTSSEGETATGSSSPITVTGLTNDVAHTFTVQAQNAIGLGAFSAASSSVTPSNPRCVFMGGDSASDSSNVIDFIQVLTTGNASDFGDLTQRKRELAGSGSSTRGLSNGGNVLSVGQTNTIEYITIASTGNGTDFGDMTSNRRALGAASNSTRSLAIGGANTNVIDYVTIASTGNATDFGDCESSPQEEIGCTANSTRAVIGGDNDTKISYVTIASTGNAAEFGNRTEANNLIGACASSTRALFAGGEQSSTNKIDYVEIGSLGNAVDFGDLVTTSNAGACGTSGLGRGIFAGMGGGGSSAYRKNIEYVTIASVGNATDFGDLSVGRKTGAATSAGHGGL